MTPIELREIILNTNKPLLIQGFEPQWRCFKDGLLSWCHSYDTAADKVDLNFERMNVTNGRTPQWESNREKVELSMTAFMAEHSSKQTFWSGLNYIRGFELPKICSEGIEFGCFGFPQATDDFSFWLSSQGANTPCHYDTYGCNIVVQVFGEKSWLLFPPDTALTTTRIPYEESSVYCLENFYSPEPAKIKSFEKFQKHAYHCVVKPGDALIVPKNWWHYVEALTTSLSINSWIPLACDADAQLDECIIKYLIEHLIDQANERELGYLLNPNQINQLATEQEMLNILEQLVCKQLSSSAADADKKIAAKKSTLRYDYHYQTMSHVEQQIRTMPKMKLLAPVDEQIYADILKRNSLRFTPDSHEQDPTTAVSCIKEALINSICQPSVVKQIKIILLQRYQNLSQQ